MVENLQKIKLDGTKVNFLKNPQPKRILKPLGLFCLGFLAVFFLISTVIMFLSIPLVSQFKKTYQLALESYQAVKNQDLITAGEKIKETKASLLKARASYKRLVWTKFIPILGIYYRDGDYFFQAAESGIEAAQILTEAVTPYADVLGFRGKGSFTGGTAEDRIVKIVQTLDEITPSLKEIKKQLEIAQKNLAEINPNHYPKTLRGKEIRSQIVKAQNLADAAVLTVTDAQPALEVLPKVSGYPKPQKYLLIMQNDGELRPTGGFMTAYAIIKVDSGRIIPEKSDDIYSLDKKNKEKIKAPEPIKKYLFSADLKTGIVPFWYLRDMNLSPDFKISMETFKKYYDGIPDEPEIEGIIAIDTKILKDLLTLLGPVEVPGYGKFTMDKDSRCHDIPQVVCEIEHIVDTPIPGIKRGRKDVLGPLMKAIINKMFDSPSNMWPGLFRLGIEEIKQKHILFFFTDEKAQIAAEKLNAAGRIREFDQDYLHVNDTNFGGAKSNLFVQHTVEQKIEIDEENNILKTLTLTYINPEPMDDCNLERKTGLCLNGILRNFLRIYVPKGSKLIQAIGSETEMKTYEELDKTVFEGFFTLRGNGGKAKVVITYQLPLKYDPQKGYSLLIQKQPGTLGHHYLIIFGDKQEEFDLVTDKELKF